MNLPSILLILGSLVFLILGCLHIYGIMAYNRRLRRQRFRSKSKLSRRKQPKSLDLMTVFLFLTALLLLMVALLVMKHHKPVEQPTEPSEGESQTIVTEPQQTQPPTETESIIPETEPAKVDVQGIVLVNPWNPVPADWETELIALSSDYGSDGCQVDRRCLNDLIGMLEACHAASSKAYVVSGYRSYEYQDRLFQRKVNSYLSAGYTQEDAEAAAAAEVARPGTSEHQLGLAVDIVDSSLKDLVVEQENLPAQKWLMEHSWEYGFIFRYPKDKTEITGIVYEPWHYRYVGKELAKAIHFTGLTLEEYMENQG